MMIWRFDNGGRKLALCPIIISKFIWMKKVLLAFLLMTSCAAFASDTLTRAQIYNFNVGDTFDYEETILNYGMYDFDQSEVVNFSRCVINHQYYSAGSDTLFIVRQWLYPLPIHYDTLTIDSLGYVQVFIDSPSNSQISIDSASNYDNRPFNQIKYINGSYGSNTYAFAVGLGYCFLSL